MLDENLVNRTYQSLRTHYRLPGVKQWWSRIGRNEFSADFVAFVEGPLEARVAPDSPTATAESPARTPSAAV